MAKTVAIVSKSNKGELFEVAPGVVRWLAARGYSAVTDPETAAYLGKKSASRTLAREKLPSVRPQFAIVLGGDGTMLAAARALARSGIPILGVNLGSLGFLTEVALDELYPTLAAAIGRKCLRERRAMLRCEVRRGSKVITRHDLMNDAVVSKTELARIADFDVYVNDQFVSNYKADGIIVATPTGSTAYSLAAGGPILSPDVNAFAVTPVSPHALTNRPLVVPDTCRITIRVRSAEGAAYLSIDGQLGERLRDGDRIVCHRSRFEVELLKLHSRTFFDVLRAKLKWGQR
ncbi:MAG: NAD(+)/NADH kinase [Acidobacteria bacterium]|nr:NAD(+)/NADH kinase [Acidobacteriota bacterium]